MGGSGERVGEMTAPTTKLQAAEHDLKQLMVDVTRAVEKAQQAVVIAAVTEPTPSSH